MLVINGVELVQRHELHQMRKLESGHAGWLQQDSEARDKVIDIWHMRQHIICGSEIGLFALRDQRVRKSNTEKFLHNVNAFGARRCRRAGSGFHTGTRNVGRLEILQ